MTAALVADCSANLNSLLQYDGAGGDENPLREPSKEQLKGAVHFMKLFGTQTKKVSHLPCFAYNLPPNPELRLLSEQWRTFSFSEGAQARGAEPRSREEQARSDRGRSVDWFSGPQTKPKKGQLGGRLER